MFLCFPPFWRRGETGCQFFIWIMLQWRKTENICWYVQVGPLMCVVESGRPFAPGTLCIHTFPSFSPWISNTLLWNEWNWELVGRSVGGIVGGYFSDFCCWHNQMRRSASLNARPSDPGHLYLFCIIFSSISIQMPAKILNNILT